jgi:hypothetical protein
MKRLLFFLVITPVALSFGAFSCKNDVEQLDSVPTSRIQIPVEKEPEIFRLVPDKDGVWDFTVGEKSEYKLEAWAPTQDRATLFFEKGLPEGASFVTEDSKDGRIVGKFVWTPSRKVLTQDLEKNSGIPPYVEPVIWVAIKSGNNNDMTHVRKHILFRIRDQAGDFKITFEKPEFSVVEEETLEVPVLIEGDPTILNRGVDLQANELPPGATLKSVSRTKYLLQYQPSLNVVSNRNPWEGDCGKDEQGQSFGCHTLPLHLKFSARDARGRRVTSQEMTIHVRNKYLSPTLLGANTVGGMGEVRFTIVAKDPNGEVGPAIRLKDVPKAGVVRLKTLPIGKDSTLAEVSWENPPSALGGESLLEFAACTAITNAPPYATAEVCSPHAVTVQFNKKPEQSLLQINRSQWPENKMRRIQLGNIASVEVPLGDRDDDHYPTDYHFISRFPQDRPLYNGHDVVIYPKPGPEPIRVYRFIMHMPDGTYQLQKFCAKVVDESVDYEEPPLEADPLCFQE